MMGIFAWRAHPRPPTADERSSVEHAFRRIAGALPGVASRVAHAARAENVS
jgi:hypothetical protein